MNVILLRYFPYERYKRALFGLVSYTDPSQLVIGAADEDVGLAVVVSTGGHSFLAIDSLCCCAGDNLSEHMVMPTSQKPQIRGLSLYKTTKMEVYSSSQNHGNRKWVYLQH